MTSKTLLRVGQVGSVLVLCLCASACGSGKVTKDNFAKIKDGMSKEAVEDFMGKGDKQSDGAGGAGVAAAVGVNVGGAKSAGGGETYMWGNDEKYIKITIRDGKVVWKDSRGL